MSPFRKIQPPGAKLKMGSLFLLPSVGRWSVLGPNVDPTTFLLLQIYCRLVGTFFVVCLVVGKPSFFLCKLAAAHAAAASKQAGVNFL